MAVRNQIASSHHTLSGLLYDTVEDQLYTTRIYDIQPIVDPMGVGDAFIAAYIHAHQKWGDENQYCLDFSLSASAIKNTIIFLIIPRLVKRNHKNFRNGKRKISLKIHI